MAKRDIPKLGAEPREKLGSRYAKRLRDRGRLPAVVYGHKQDPVHVSVDAWHFERLLEDGAHLLNVELDSTTESCLIKDIQLDHLGSHVVHADLTRVDMSEQVEVELELELTGEPEALEEAGAILSQPLTSLAVRCRADAIPEKLTHDISELTQEGSVTVGDLKLPSGMETDVDPETMVAQIQIMQEEPEEEPAEEAAEGEEPEVIGKGEGEEEGEASGEGESES